MGHLLLLLFLKAFEGFYESPWPAWAAGWQLGFRAWHVLGQWRDWGQLTPLSSPWPYTYGRLFLGGHFFEGDWAFWIQTSLGYGYSFTQQQEIQQSTWDGVNWAGVRVLPHLKGGVYLKFFFRGHSFASQNLASPDSDDQWHLGWMQKWGIHRIFFEFQQKIRPGWMAQWQSPIARSRWRLSLSGWGTLMPESSDPWPLWRCQHTGCAVVNRSFGGLSLAMGLIYQGVNLIVDCRSTLFSQFHAWDISCGWLYFWGWNPPRDEVLDSHGSLEDSSRPWPSFKQTLEVTGEATEGVEAPSRVRQRWSNPEFRIELKKLPKRSKKPLRRKNEPSL